MSKSAPILENRLKLFNSSHYLRYDNKCDHFGVHASLIRTCRVTCFGSSSRFRFTLFSTWVDSSCWHSVQLNVIFRKCSKMSDNYRIWKRFEFINKFFLNFPNSFALLAFADEFVCHCIDFVARTFWIWITIEKGWIAPNNLLSWIRIFIL